MAAFREYFKAHTDWVEKGTRVSGLKTRKTLRLVENSRIKLVRGVPIKRPDDG